MLGAQDAKRASEQEGQFIFAKPDHVGVQVPVCYSTPKVEMTL